MSKTRARSRLEHKVKHEHGLIAGIVSDIAGPAAMCALYAPIHEGLHTGSATALHFLGKGLDLALHTNFGDSIACRGIELTKGPVTSALEILSLGYVHAGNANQALLSYSQNLYGNAALGITFLVPEAVTIGLAMHWFNECRTNISQKGKRLYGFSRGFASLALVWGVYGYMRGSVMSPHTSDDYVGVASAALQILGLPASWANGLTGNFVATSIAAGVAGYVGFRLSEHVIPKALSVLDRAASYVGSAVYEKIQQAIPHGR